MAFETATLEGHMDIMIADIPITVTFGVDDIIMTRTELSKEIIYSEFGYGSGYEFSVIGKRSDFSTQPIKGDKVTISSAEYRVLRVNYDSADVRITIDLGDKV